MLYADIITFFLKNDLENILGRSYLHQNGFSKIVLFKSIDCQIRLHIWDGNHKEEENIHNHRFNFNSSILQGQYREEIFEQDSFNGDDYFAYSYAPKSELNYELIRQENIKLKKVGRFTYKEGDGVSRQASVLHKVSPISSVVCSLLVASGNVNNQCLVLSEKEIITNVNTSNLHESELRYLIKNHLKIEI